jgi:heat-inducible transcriptional repressor
MFSRQLYDDRPAPIRAVIDLTERQQSVLRAVVEDYVITAVPVGSKTLVQRHGLGVSSATIRSAMAELEALGLLSHPHTSAGRVPSDLGYRIYVESLMREAQLDRADQLMIRHQFRQVQLTSNDWLRLAASILAGSTRSASVVTPARSRRARFGHLQLVQLADASRLCVLVLADGNVVQRRLDRAAVERLREETPVGQPELDQVAATFNRELATLAAPAVRRRTASQEPFHALVGEMVAALLEEADSAVVEEVITDGLANVLEQPEFAQGLKLRGVLEVLQRSDFFEQLIPVLARRQGVHVIIGHENTIDAMHDVSLVFAPYGQPDQALGMLGVLGPTRMPYPRAIRTVGYLSNLMNELITNHHGETDD